MARFVTTFLLILLPVFLLGQTETVRLGLTEPFTAQIAAVSASLVSLADPDAYSAGYILGSRSSGFAVAIRPGCNGVEVMVLLAAAILAFPASWRYRTLGMALGMLAIQVLNLARIISLFYIGQWNEVVFEWAHLYVWPALIMLDALIVFLIWLYRQPTPAPA